MKIRMYKFSKRDNSTKQPSASDSYVVKDIILKDDTDIHTPSIELHTTDATYTYVYIPDWDKYYFVSDVTYINNSEVIYNLEEDSLATKKADIGNTVAHIAYSSTGWDKWKIDNRIAVKATKTYASSSDTPGGFDSTGSFILTVVNDQSKSGMTCQYIITPSALRAIATEIFNNSGLVTELKEYLASAFDSIVSCKWIPFSASEAPGSLEQVKLGKTAVNANGYLLQYPCVKNYNATVSVPWQHTDFRRCSPYTSLSMWLPGFGYTDINANDIINLSSIKCDFRVDWGCGDVCCNIVDAVSGTLFQSISYNVAVDVPVSNYTIDIAGVISGISNVTGSGVGLGTSVPMAVQSGNIGSLVGGFSNLLGSGAQAILSANKREVSVKGSVGGRAIISEGIAVKLYAFTQDTEDPDNTNYIAKWGRPVGETHAISNHSGYVQCDNASIAMDGDSYERAKINAYLNSGFYYE